MTEAEIQAAVRRALGELPDVFLWRNHVGSVQDQRGRWHTFGLAPGSADLVGILKPGARFFSLEVKSATGRLRPEQAQWIDMVRRFGGFAAVVRSADEALAAVARARAGAAA